MTSCTQTELQTVKISGRSPEQQNITCLSSSETVTLRILGEFYVVLNHLLFPPGKQSVIVVREDFYLLLVEGLQQYISYLKNTYFLTSVWPEMRGAKIMIKTYIIFVSMLDHFYVPGSTIWFIYNSSALTKFRLKIKVVRRDFIMAKIILY